MGYYLAVKKNEITKCTSKYTKLENTELTLMQKDKTLNVLSHLWFLDSNLWKWEYNLE